MKEVTLNKNSWHFKYYSTIVSDTPPKSLCPYFWTMVILIIISPFIGLGYGGSYVSKKITSLFPKKEKRKETFEEIMLRLKLKEDREEKRQKFWNKVGEITKKISIYFILPFLIGYVGYFLFIITTTQFVNMLMAIGIILLFFGFIFLIVHLIQEYGGKVVNSILRILKPLNIFNWKITQIIGVMIKAQYTKMCPLVTWIGDNKTINT